MSRRAKWFGTLSASVALGLILAIVLGAGATLYSFRELPTSFEEVVGGVQRIHVEDRFGTPLNATYINEWNLTDEIAIHEVPELLVDAFVIAEDKRFFRHRGQDWLARLAASATNIAKWKKVRGASTISEQVVRMIHKRPRTLWTRWVEGWEAVQLEKKFSKWEILEFYLNQVPYASNRRGVVQGARTFFDRDLTTLSDSELLALAVMVRAPSILQPSQDLNRLRESIGHLRDQLVQSATLDHSNHDTLDLDLRSPQILVRAPHFVRFARSTVDRETPTVRSTLDGSLQSQLQPVVDSRLYELQEMGADSGALLVVDVQTSQVLAWVVATLDYPNQDVHYDTVLLKRQPGSALKPFLYAIALSQGWTASTLIEDTPLSERVLEGIHHYRNYSNRHYGPISLRNALGNSLNIPAVRTLRFVGGKNFLSVLKQLGLVSLAQEATYYGGGLALGNGEVSLFELVRAYGVLANRGVYRELTITEQALDRSKSQRVFTPEVASLISSILSDPEARALEFGSGVLNFPYQTAIKTGTSTAFRDSWSIAYNNRYVVGAWIGNLENRPMQGVTGSIGSASVVRSTFDILNRRDQPEHLWVSPKLEKKLVSTTTGLLAQDNDHSSTRIEYFIERNYPRTTPLEQVDFLARNSSIRFVAPTSKLEFAIDPRIPMEHQAYEFILDGVNETDEVEWSIDGVVTNAQGGRLLWNMTPGNHVLRASVKSGRGEIIQTDSITFIVR